MNFFRQLAVKPWLAIDEENYVPANNVNKSAEKTALKFFLSVVTLLFFLTTITFLSRSQYPDFQALSGEAWLPFTNPAQLWMNSGLLLLASICLQAAVVTTKKQQLNASLLAVFGGVFFSASFIYGQLMVWQQLSNEGYFIYSNPANSYFYLFTGIHGIHLLGGIVALGKVVIHFWRNNNLASLNKSVSLCAIYWHYLFMVWVFLFALLTATPEIYSTIALICGF